jgi:hypothetical protein
VCVGGGWVKEGANRSQSVRLNSADALGHEGGMSGHVVEGDMTCESGMGGGGRRGFASVIPQRCSRGGVCVCHRESGKRFKCMGASLRAAAEAHVHLQGDLQFEHWHEV